MPHMNKPPSDRQQLAQRFAEWLHAADMCSPYGGDVSLQRIGRPHYNVLFSKPAVLDGGLAVYSPKFIVIEWITQFRAMPREGRRVFETELDARDFLQLAFVEHEFTLAMDVPHRS
jgi:hypothetical protein